MRGQEEAPVELLIGVTVLAFVLIIGIYTYQNMCASQFEQKMRTSLSDFARNIELVYKGSIGTSLPVKVDFAPIGCMRGDVESIRLVQGDPDLCMSQLGEPECLVLAVKIINKQLSDESLVVETVNVPAGTVVRYVNRNCKLTSGEYQRLNELSFSSTNWNDPSLKNCGWELRPYSLMISKTSAGILEIA
jgi:hypothetical protein